MMMDDQLPHHRRRSPLFIISSNNLLWLQLNASSFRRARSYFILYPGALQYNSNAVTTSPWKKLHFLFSPNASLKFYIINFGHILILYDGDFVCIWIWRFGSAFSGITMTNRRQIKTTENAKPCSWSSPLLTMNEIIRTLSLDRWLLYCIIIIIILVVHY